MDNLGEEEEERAKPSGQPTFFTKMGAGLGWATVMLLLCYEGRAQTHTRAHTEGTKSRCQMSSKRVVIISISSRVHVLLYTVPYTSHVP